MLIHAGCDDENSYPQKQWMQPGRALTQSTQSSQQMVTIMFVILLKWPCARMVWQTEVFLHQLIHYLYHECGEESPESESWRILKQSTSSSLEPLPLLPFSKAMKKILGLLGSCLTPKYISTAKCLNSLAQKAGEQGFSCRKKCRGSLQNRYGVNVRCG